MRASTSFSSSAISMTMYLLVSMQEQRCHHHTRGAPQLFFCLLIVVRMTGAEFALRPDRDITMSTMLTGLFVVFLVEPTTSSSTTVPIV